MSAPLEEYFERQLAALHELSADFARRYRVPADRLMRDPGVSIDPHLERFIEGFALLAGRVEHKLDETFPELTEALAQILYPHLLRPIPSMAIAQFEPPAAWGDSPSTTHHIPRHTQLTTRLLGNPPLPCRWRTGYDVNVWPIQVTGAQVQRPPFHATLQVPPRTAAILRLQLECVGAARLADLPLDKLRFYLSGDSQVVANLYEVLLKHTLQVAFRSLDREVVRPPLVLPPEQCLHAVGLDLDEGLLPMPEVSFVGYRLLLEFLAFRDKFWFLDLSGWQQVSEAGFGKKVEVVLCLSRVHDNLDQGVRASTFLLGCTPIINLFSKSAEPIDVSQKQYAYRVVPSRLQPQGMEVFSVDAVTSFDPVERRTTEHQPMYAFAPGQSREDRYAFWHGTRRASPQEGDRGTEVFLTLVDPGFNPRLPAEAVLDVRTTCTNRDWPQLFQRAGEELFVHGGGPTAPGRILCLHQPTPVLRPPLRRSAHWRLLAQNGLNHISLADPEVGREALQEILRLCDFAEAMPGSPLALVNQQIIEGIQRLQARRVLGRADSGGRIGFCRGLEVTLEFDEKKYVGVGLFLFACVLERFLGLYAAVNSFNQLIARTQQGDIIKKWPPRAGARQLL